MRAEIGIVGILKALRSEHSLTDTKINLDICPGLPVAKESSKLPATKPGIIHGSFTLPRMVSQTGTENKGATFYTPDLPSDV